MKGLTTLVALLFFASAAIGDDHESGYLVEIGEGLSQSSHIYKLQGRATLADVDKIDLRLHKWQDANGLEVVRSRLEPLFVPPQRWTTITSQLTGCRGIASVKVGTLS